MIRVAALALVLCAAAGLPAAAQGGLPVEVQDPATRGAVTLESGPRLLHVVFFATWCPHCLEEFDRLSNLEARWQPRGYRLVLVAVRNRHTAEKLELFGKQRDLPGRLLFDAEGTAEARLGAGDLPTHLLFDATGKEIARAGSLAGDIEKTIQARMRPEGGR